MWKGGDEISPASSLLGETCLRQHSTRGNREDQHAVSAGGERNVSQTKHTILT